MTDSLHIPPYNPPTATPTADAYQAACAALERHRERADRAEAALARVRAVCDHAERVTGSSWDDVEDPTPVPGWTAMVRNAIDGVAR